MSLASFASPTQTSGGSSGVRPSVRFPPGKKHGRPHGKVTPPSSSFHPLPPKQSKTTRLGSTSQPSTGRKSQRAPRIRSLRQPTRVRSNVQPATSEERHNDQIEKSRCPRCCFRAVVFQQRRRGAVGVARSGECCGRCSR